MNATTANVVSVSVSSPVEGSTATHQESIVKQTFALKVQFNDDIRRFNLTELSFEPLVKRVAEVFKIPEAKLLLKYQDEEGDLVTITSTDDLFDAQRLAAQRSAMLRLTASCNRKKKADDVANIVLAPNAQPVSRAAVPAPSSPVIDYRVQKKALKEQKKLLKEEKKKLLKSGSSGDYKEQKKLLKEEKKELKSGKEELKAIKKEAKQIQRSAREAIRENWRSMSPEDRMAIRKARQEARGQVGDGKSWKDMSREERIATRLARREARMAEGGHSHACRNKIVGRFVKHVTIPDGTTFEPRQPFTKTWRMRNEGAEPWTDCKLIFVSRKNGDLMGAPEEVVIPSPVAPGSEVDVSVQMVAPEQPGRYVGFWRLSAADGRKFGQRIWVKIDVVVSSSSSSDEKDLAQSGGFKQMEDEIEESFIDIKEEKEEEPLPTKPTIAELLKQLKALGFSDVGRNIPLLKKHNGDINKVIADLIA